jgi:hypothetical protein
VRLVGVLSHFIYLEDARNHKPKKDHYDVDARTVMSKIIRHFGLPVDFPLVSLTPARLTYGSLMPNGSTFTFDNLLK